MKHIPTAEMNKLNQVLLEEFETSIDEIMNDLESQIRAVTKHYIDEIVIRDRKFTALGMNVRNQLLKELEDKIQRPDYRIYSETGITPALERTYFYYAIRLNND